MIENYAVPSRASVTVAGLVAAYAGSVALANHITASFGVLLIGNFPFPAGTVLAGLTFGLRDLLHERGKRWVVLGILLGGLASLLTSSPALAFASVTAFAVAELLDFGVYSPLRHRSASLAVVLSNLVGSVADTWLFLHLAGFDVSWQLVVGQVVVKTVSGTLVAWTLLRDRRP